MFEVARSRRMCCSRVWSVSTYPVRPSRSVVRPTMRPGICRIYSSRQANSPSHGPPKFTGQPKLCPSATTMSAPYSPGGVSIPSEIGIDRRDVERARSVRRFTECPDIDQVAEERRLLDREARMRFRDLAAIENIDRKVRPVRVQSARPPATPGSRSNGPRSGRGPSRGTPSGTLPRARSRRRTCPRSPRPSPSARRPSTAARTSSGACPG